MKTKMRLTRSSKLAAAFVVGGLMLSGCIRSILGPAQTFSLLAGKKIVASSPFVPSGGVGAAGGTVNVSGSASADNVFAGLDSLINTEARLRALPQEEVTTADLLAGPVSPGFYHVAGSLSLPAGAHLHLMGDGLYVFNVDGILALGTGAAIHAGEGVRPGNVFLNVRKSATLGGGSQLSGILISEGDITADTGAMVNGKLLSRTGNIFLNTSQVVDGTLGIDTPPMLHVPANVYRVAPGQPVSFTVSADLFGFPGEVGLFVKDLPAGAVQTPNQDGPDSSGPNGSDLLDDAVIGPLSGASAQSTFTWTPTVPGTYRVTYLARSKGFSGSPSLTPTAFDSDIDVCTVTIEVGNPGSSAGLVSGSGVFGSGPYTGTFALAVSSRGGNGAGTLRFSTISPRIAFQSQTIQSVQVYDLDNGARGATIQGTALVSNFGLVPFTVTAIDGARGTEPDLLRVTVLADVRHNGSETTTFGGPVNRRSGEVLIR
jgi:type VI secretion system secreted protein VgrG